MQKTFTTRRMAAAAVLAAAYCAVSLALAPLSFGAVQMRVSEAFTLLPVFSPAAIWGVTLGCALSNALGSSMGLIDVVFGTSATLIAALMSYALRNMRIHGRRCRPCLSMQLSSALKSPLFLRAAGIPACLYHRRCLSVSGRLSPAVCWACFWYGRLKGITWRNGFSEPCKKL